MILRILRYRLKIAGKRLGASLLSAVPPPYLTILANPAPVTVFISSFNTRYPLELTLRTLARCTRYPDYRLCVADNGSTDGSREFLEALSSEARGERQEARGEGREERGEAGFSSRLTMRLIASPHARLHSEWLDEVFRTVDTPYWLAVDSDMLFLGRDWLADMLSVMESRPDLYLLAAERREPCLHFVEPVSGEVIDLAEAPSTWLFCVRTSLRDRLQTSFAFHKGDVNLKTGNLRCWDTGGKVLADMRANRLRYDYMPGWYRCKYHHFGSLSWGTTVTDVAGDDPRTALKRYQLDEIRRRVVSLRP